MKISTETLDILKNFAEINKGLFFKKGSVLSTVSPQKNVLATAKVKETFPMDFCIYDLPELIGVMTLFKEPDVDFQDKQLVISGRSKVTYRYTDPSLIIIPPLNEIKLVSEDIKFTISADELAWLFRSADALKSPQCILESDGDKVFITTMDVQNDASNTNRIEIQEGDGNVYRMIFKRENMKLMAGTYKVTVTEKNIARFVNETDTLTYFISTEIGSTFKRKK